MTQAIRNTIARMREHERERAYLLAVLELWAQAEAQGVDPETVKSFGFDPKLAGKALLRESRTWKARMENGRRTIRPLVFNYARHHDGTRTTLDPPLTAVYRD